MWGEKTYISASDLTIMFIPLLFRWTVKSEPVKSPQHRAGSQSPLGVFHEEAAIELYGGQDGWRGHSPGKI